MAQIEYWAAAPISLHHHRSPKHRKCQKHGDQHGFRQLSGECALALVNNGVFQRKWRELQLSPGPGGAIVEIGVPR
ncbi:MAG: hypothetical protein PHV34_23040 [Verrucomicrobiae bacterium]|nr:hypothetical protein [Verrucomicrobiae bacterium]